MQFRNAGGGFSDGTVELMIGGLQFLFIVSGLMNLFFKNADR